jgi:uncharacterized protein YkwD
MSVTPVRSVLLPALVIALLAVPASAEASARTDATEAAIMRGMNSLRAAYHVPRLHLSHALSRAADAQSAHLLRTRVFSHGAAFSHRMRRYVHSRHVGENLAWLGRCDASQVVQMWLNSAAHRRIMLERGFRRVGVGRRSSAGTCYVTADFASAH